MIRLLLLLSLAMTRGAWAADRGWAWSGYRASPGWIVIAVVVGCVVIVLGLKAWRRRR